MLPTIFGPGRNKQLNEKIQRIEMNCANNYKDAAQMNLREYEEMLTELKACGKVKGKAAAYYEERLADFKCKMDKYTHKDQKPKW